MLELITLRVYEKAVIGQNQIANKEFNTVATAKKYYKDNYNIPTNKVLAYIDSKSENNDSFACIWKLENSKRWQYIGM